jgi:hypothetical protein
MGTLVLLDGGQVGLGQLQDGLGDPLCLVLSAP